MAASGRRWQAVLIVVLFLAAVVAAAFTGWRYARESPPHQGPIIIISADGKDEVAPALKEAMAKGIKVVGFDSSPAVGAYDVFVNQVDFSGGNDPERWATTWRAYRRKHGVPSRAQTVH